MKQNIWSTWNLGAVILIGLIAFLPNTSSLSIIGSTWFIIGYLLGTLPSLLRSRDSSQRQKLIKYLGMNGHDDKILEILNDELHHSKELHDAMELV